MSDLVRLTAVEKIYSRHSRVAIDHLALPAGGRVLVSGDNGSGKSTLLRLIAGISLPDSGQIWRADDWKRLRIGYVPQHGGLYDDLSVAANLEVRRTLFGTASDTDRLVARVGLEPWMSKRAGDLSGGYRRLVAVVAALAIEPDVLIMDEPLDALDDDRRDEFQALLAESIGTLRLLIVAAPSSDYPVPSLDAVVTLNGGRATCEPRTLSV
jgi:ABC-type multidrug transport system ATPase subunit